MNEHTIIYEQAINEQIRVSLKTEQFFKRIDDMLKIDSPWACENLARAIIDIMVLFDRTDIKAKISKQLRELSEELKQLLLSPHCDKQQTTELVTYIEHYQQFLLTMEGKFLDTLRDDSLLKIIKHCLYQPSGPCSLEAPAMHRWIAQSYDQRYKKIQQWLNHLMPIRSIVTVILHILRESTSFTSRTSHDGHYSHNLKATKDCQLVRVKLPKECAVYPEMSASRQHLNIRFLQVNDNKSSHEDIPFELSLCH